MLSLNSENHRYPISGPPPSFFLIHHFCVTFENETSHKIDELKKYKKGGVHKSGTYGENVTNMELQIT
jgi:gamma-glutamylcyclotransferase (GGCT)/AIG2-like uncharacterized protein YtfP